MRETAFGSKMVMEPFLECGIGTYIHDCLFGYSWTFRGNVASVSFIMSRFVPLNLWALMDVEGTFAHLPLTGCYNEVACFIRRNVQ